MQYFRMGLKALQAHGLRVAAAVALAVTCTGVSAAEPGDMVQRGRYLVQIAGCNDCHTPGYMETAGAVDEKLWLTGNPVGWNGPWGTTYPPNLRLVAQMLTEDQWVVHARTPRRPPMPWFAVRDMTDQDVRAIYEYLRHAGPAGEPAPAALAPGVEPPEPVFRAPPPPPAAKGG
jgi:mono/diheme cytochrome c family protein